LGYDFKQKRITLGRPLDFPDKRRYSVHDVLENNLQLNSFHLNPGDFESLYHSAIKFRPRLLVGHPAALYTFCLQTEKMGLEPLQVPLVCSISEKLYPHHIQKFSEHFGATVYDYYGNRENTLAVTQFSCGGKHINSEFGLVEFIKDGKTCEPGEAGSIVTTPLENYSTPLLRYDTGDLGKPLGRCSNCRRVHPTMEIMGGRGKDVLLTRDGFINCHLDTYLTRHKFTGADYIQVVQTELGRIKVRILPNKEYRGEDDAARLQSLARDCLSGYFEVEVEELTEPPFTEAGKMPYVISELAREREKPSTT
jgi:phenylacetate-CoA ligase